MENNDKILKDFFAENKKEIIDNRFSSNVMQKLPTVKEVQWIIPVFTIIGFTIMLFFIDIQKIIFKIYLFVIQLPIVYITAAFFAIPFIVLAIWYANEKNYRLFE